MCISLRHILTLYVETHISQHARISTQVDRRAGNFWDCVTKTHIIDLTPFNLPAGSDRVTFTCVDPVYTWISRANALHRNGIPLFWDPVSLLHPDTGEQCYGVGIQYSKILRCAHKSRLVERGKIALFNINWDGGLTGSGSRSCTPIHVQVMNCNSGSAVAVGLVGYLPYIDVPEGYQTQKNCVEARQYLLQTCIGHVVDAIESRAEHGVRCTIGEATMLLFPRIGVMSLDTPERIKYFGLTNTRACAICRRRKGRSAFRDSTHHVPEEIEKLLDESCVPDRNCRTMTQRRARKRAREKTSRYGFDYKKRCRLSEHAKHSLVHVDSISPRLFAGLCRYERMHVYYIGYCSYLLDLLVLSVRKKDFCKVDSIVKQCHHFRDPSTGAVHPRLPHLTKMVHLTAERRVRAIFYWAHVLGVSAEVVHPPNIRLAAQRAVSTLQLILISMRGHRAYTSRELDQISKGVGREFFSALEELASHHENSRYHRQMGLHEKNPVRHKAPTRFVKQVRSVKYCTSTSYIIPLRLHTCTSTLYIIPLRLHERSSTSYIIPLRLNTYTSTLYRIPLRRRECTSTSYILPLRLNTCTSTLTGTRTSPILRPPTVTAVVVVWVFSSTVRRRSPMR